MTYNQQTVWDYPLFSKTSSGQPLLHRLAINFEDKRHAYLRVRCMPLDNSGSQHRSPPVPTCRLLVGIREREYFRLPQARAANLQPDR